jgi:3-phosphoshikimate 1-carboxyvinyltransferase
VSRTASDDVREQHPQGALQGRLRAPGDKSVSHRSLIFGGQARGTTRVRGLLRSGDVHATWGAMAALGVAIEDHGDEVLVHGVPVLSEPRDVVDCGNSGTSIRLLAGVLSRIDGLAVLTGDASLRGRPMGRVAVPLRRMGARIDGREGGRLAPLAIRGGELRPVDHDLSVASAQVKSCLLLAGLACGTRVREPRQSRDHSERFFGAMGRPLRTDDAGWLEVVPGPLDPIDVEVPADVSSAAFLLVAASLVPGSEVELPAVGLNPTRTGVIDALRAMGADIEVVDEDRSGVEPMATLVVRHAPLRGHRIDGDLALRSLDELPVLAVAAAFAEGETVIADAAELRVKESDRIARVAEGLRRLGVQVEERPDGMVIQGGVRSTVPAEVDASGDHRIAMAFTVAGLVAPAGVRVRSASAVHSSWPSFYDDLTTLLPRRAP